MQGSGKSSLDTGKRCKAKMRWGRVKETSREKPDNDDGNELHEPSHKTNARLIVFRSARRPRISGGAEENQRDAGGDFKEDGLPVQAGKHQWRSQAGGAQLGPGQVQHHFGWWNQRRVTVLGRVDGWWLQEGDSETHIHTSRGIFWRPVIIITRLLRTKGKKGESPLGTCALLT